MVNCHVGTSLVILLTPLLVVTCTGLLLGYANWAYDSKMVMYHEIMGAVGIPTKICCNLDTEVSFPYYFMVARWYHFW